MLTSEGRPHLSIVAEGTQHVWPEERQAVVWARGSGSVPTPVHVKVVGVTCVSCVLVTRTEYLMGVGGVSGPGIQLRGR